MTKVRKKRRRTDLLLAGANLLLLTYIIYLFFSNYSSQKDIRRSAEGRMADQVAKQATSIGYFISERRNDLKRLARSSGVLSYFQSKALGMSMKYGLRATLIQTEQEFIRLLEEDTFSGQSGFAHLFFTEAGGRLLIEDHRVVIGGKSSALKCDPKIDGTIQWHSCDCFNGVIVSSPVIFKNKFVGRIVGWIKLDPLLEIMGDSEGDYRWNGVFLDGDLLYSSIAIPRSLLLNIPNRLSERKVIAQNGNILAIAPIPGTPFDLGRSLPAYEVFGRISPLQQIIGVGAVITMLLICLIGYLRYLERKRARVALQESEERLRQSEKMDSIGRLAGGIAHDFNNTLSAILGGAELIELNLPPEDKVNRQMVQLIKNASKRASDLTTNLLTFSRQGKPISTLVNIHTIINETLALLKHTIDKGVEIIAELDAEFVSIMGDPSQIQNAILNLAINARDAMPKGGTLNITTKNIVFDQNYCDASSFELIPGEYIAIDVRDDGEGIPKDVQERVFEPFFTTKAHGKGTGLGLAAVYGTVCMHDGAITVYSELEMGTRFHIYLPVLVETEDVLLYNTDDLDMIDSGSGTILVVDDEEVVRTTAKMLLTFLGYDVLLAVDGVDGLERFKQNSDKIKVVILDMIMPHMGGADTFRAIREIAPDAKVIISSGFIRDESIAALLKEGVVGFLPKPYQRKELAQILSECLSKDNAGNRR